MTVKQQPTKTKSIRKSTVASNAKATTNKKPKKTAAKKDVGIVGITKTKKKPDRKITRTLSGSSDKSKKDEKTTANKTKTSTTKTTKKTNKSVTVSKKETTTKNEELIKIPSKPTQEEDSREKEIAEEPITKNTPIQTAVSISKQPLAKKPPRPVGPPTDHKKVALVKTTGLRHQDSVSLYRNGWGPAGQNNIVVTKSSAEVDPAPNQRNPNRPIFHLPLNLNDSTASFQGTSPSYLEMSSGLVPHHPQNKYNFRISLDETNDMSQTANMLRNYIFNNNNEWNSDRTESSHRTKQPENEQQYNLPDGFDEKDSSFIIPSTETTNRSFMANMGGRTSTRLSFLYNKSTGLLCKNCFSSTCNHMDKFDTLATPKLKKVFRSSSSVDKLEADSSDVSHKHISFEDLLEESETSNRITESMRLLEVNDFYHHDVSSGERVPFREISMEYENSDSMIKFETSTPNDDSPRKSTDTSKMSMSDSMLRYTPAIMNQPGLQQQRPKTNESLKYDSDYDDDSYLQAACQTTSANNTFETLDVNSGVFFSNIEPNESADAPIQSSTPTPTTNFNNSAPGPSNKLKTRRKSLITMPELPTVFEEKSAPNSAIKSDRSETQENKDTDGGLEEILQTVTGNLANMSVYEEPTPLASGELVKSEKDETVKNNVSKSNKIATETGTTDEEKNSENEHKSGNRELLHKEKEVVTEEETNSPELNDALQQNEEALHDSLDEDEEKEVSNVDQDSKEDSKPTSGDCMTPLESQGIFKRIKTEDEVSGTPVADADLQAVLQENRKHTFERQYFYNKVRENTSSVELDVYDREVLEINTPEWAEKQKQNDTQNNTQQLQPTVPLKEPLTVDAATQSDDLPIQLSPPKNQTPQTGESSDTIKTQGSYRQIDLLVLDRGRQQQQQIQPQFDPHLLDPLETRDTDSGVHSDHTNRSYHSEGTILNYPNNNVNNNYNILRGEETPEYEQEDNMSSASQNIRTESGNSGQSPRQMYESRQPQRVYENERVYLPAIGKRYFNPLSGVENDMYFSEGYNNRLVINRRLTSPYYSSEFGEGDIMAQPHRDVVSPILEHHIKMAHYHRERVALLTPLYNTPNLYSKRNTPEPHPPETRSHAFDHNFRRRFSATRNMFYDNSAKRSDYLETLSDISPRTRPFQPHPPSYKRLHNSKRQRHHSEDLPMEEELRWKRGVGNARRPFQIDTEHDLYLTAPYRSLYRK
ncbi:general transcriptional corepressor trfA-like [Clytia hemisphaerica]|uniref:general transcriptional corepressor trfA-like n=1 Tax=Clytia hemisphaerica TaxID=252671 RepID=UPI0034D4DD6D